MTEEQYDFMRRHYPNALIRERILTNATLHLINQRPLPDSPIEAQSLLQAINILCDCDIHAAINIPYDGDHANLTGKE